jgi:hypothetical protein
MHLYRENITPDNIVPTLKKFNIPENISYVDINFDISSTEFWLFRALVSGGYRPRIVSIPYNSNYPISSTIVNAGGSYRTVRGDRIFGAALGAVGAAAEELGYAVVDVIRHHTVLLLRKEDLHGSRYPALSHWAAMTQVASLDSETTRLARSEAVALVDYRKWSGPWTLNVTEGLLRETVVWVCGEQRAWKVPVIQC